MVPIIASSTVQFTCSPCVCFFYIQDLEKFDRQPACEQQDESDCSSTQGCDIIPASTLEELRQMAERYLPQEARNLLQGYNPVFLGEVQIYANSLLLIAVQQGSLNVLKYLTEACGADIERPGFYKTSEGQTHQAPPIYVASKMNEQDVVRYLVEKGACVNATDNNGWTCVMTACDRRHTAMVTYLVEHGADINKANQRGETCLMFSTPCLELTEYLVMKRSRSQHSGQTWLDVRDACMLWR